MSPTLTENIKYCLGLLEALLGKKQPRTAAPASREPLDDLYRRMKDVLREAAQAQDAVNLYRSFTENVRDSILLIRHRDGKVLDANRAASKIYGYSKQDLLSLTIDDIRAPESRPELRGQMAKAAREGILFETEHLRRDGSRFPVEVNSSGITFKGERVLISIIRDISDRKKAEEALKEGESRLKLELDRISLLRNIASAAASTLSIEEICNRVLEETRLSLAARLGSIYYRDESENALIHLSLFGYPEEFAGQFRKVPLDSDTIVAKLVREGGSIITHESPAISEPARERIRKAGLEDTRWFILPIRSRGRIIGSFMLAFEGVRAFTEEEVHLYASIAGQLGVAIQNAKLFEEEVELRKQARYELEISNFLLRAADVLTSTIDMQRVLNSLADIALEVTRRKRVIIGLVEHNEVVIMISRGPLSPQPGKHWNIEALSFYVRQALDERRTIVADYDSESSREALDKMDIDRSRLAVIVPMLFSGRLIGIVMVDSPDEKKPFSDREMDLLDGIASQAAISIENARLYRERRQAEKEFKRLVHRYSLILESAGEGIMGLDRSGYHTFVNEAAAEMLGWDKDELIGKKSHGLWHYAREDGTPYPEGECRIYGTLRDGVRQQVNDEVFWRKDGTSFSVEYTATPIQEENAIIGSVVTFRDITDRKKSESWLREAYTEITRSVHELEERNREIGLLSEMGSLLQASVMEEEAHSIIARFTRQMFEADSGAVYLLVGEKNLLEAITFWGNVTRDELVLMPNECWGLRLGRAYEVDDIGTEVMCPHIRHEVSGPYLCIPMMAQGETLGLLHLELESERREIPEEVRKRLRSHKRRFASAVAEDIALSLANFRLRSKLYFQSIHDPLTGLFNRRYMEELLEKELHRMARKEAPLGLIMIDIDFFKQVNDTYGHEAGDVYLHELGAFLQRNIRNEDYACRYGGEEFLIILPEAGLETTRERAEQLLVKARSITVTYRESQIGTVTLSMGVAAYPACGRTVDELLRAADSGLYKAKAEGRNRVLLPR